MPHCGLAIFAESRESDARQRDVNSIKAKTALPSTHFSFFARSLMAKPCNPLLLWACTPLQDFVKNPKESIAISHWHIEWNCANLSQAF